MASGPSRQTHTSPSRHLLDRATLIKQGAEARVYTLDSLLPSPTIYWPPAGPSRTLPSGASALNSTAAALSTQLTSASPNPQKTTRPTGPSNADAPSPPDKDNVIMKYRFPKTYRHPNLDASLTRTRLSFEARTLARCARAGVVVPKVLWVDEKEGVIGMEKIEGWSVREVLGGGAEGEIEEDDESDEEVEAGTDPNGGEKLPALKRLDVSDISEDLGQTAEVLLVLQRIGVSQEHLMKSIGTALGCLHDTTIIHGDLTTSNMMIRLTPGSAAPYEIVLIDFGLSSMAQYAEHYAVDLYVLERAFASTHPQSETLYRGVLDAYAERMGEKKWKPIEGKLKEVRLRGRKRDMTG